MRTVVSKNKVLQSAATTGNGTVAELDGMAARLTLYIIGSAGVGAGAVQLETAHDPAYAGTWAPLGGAPVTVAADTVKTVSVEGAFLAVRSRISTTVTGGTVTCMLTAN